jgi:hypothetical protein
MFSVADLRFADTSQGLATRKYRPICSPKPRQKISGLILNESCIVIDTHWIETHTVPCVGEERCEFCRAKIPIRIKGYIGVIMPLVYKEAIFEITTDALRKNKAFASGKVNYRGSLITLERMGSYRNSPVRMEIVDRLPGPTLPPEFDLAAALIQIFNGEFKSAGGAK